MVGQARTHMSMNGRNRGRWRPFLYKSCGGRLDVATITRPQSNRPENRRFISIASPTSVTCGGAKPLTHTTQTHGTTSRSQIHKHKKQINVIADTRQRKQGREKHPLIHANVPGIRQSTAVFPVSKGQRRRGATALLLHHPYEDYAACTRTQTGGMSTTDGTEQERKKSAQHIGARKTRYVKQQHWRARIGRDSMHKQTNTRMHTPFVDLQHEFMEVYSPLGQCGG